MVSIKWCSFAVVVVYRQAVGSKKAVLFRRQGGRDIQRALVTSLPTLDVMMPLIMYNARIIVKPNRMTFAYCSFNQ